MKASGGSKAKKAVTSEAKQDDGASLNEVDTPGLSGETSDTVRTEVFYGI
jgi:hypothetical protein